MTPDLIGREVRSRLPLPAGSLLGFVLAVLAVLAMALFNFRSQRAGSEAGDRVSHTLEVQGQLQALGSTLKDAETGQRGFLLTGTASYLQPYQDARTDLPVEIKALRQLTADNPTQQRRLDALDQVTAIKMDELERTIELRRANSLQAALEIVASDQGKTAMDRIRALLQEMEAEERNLLAARQADAQRAAKYAAAVSTGGSTLLLILITVAGALASRDHLAREAQAWIRNGQMGLAAKLQGETRLNLLGERALEFLARYLDAPVGAIYLAESASHFRRFAGYALPPDAPQQLHSGNSLPGQAARENRVLHVRDLPHDYLTVASSTGRAKSNELLLAPASADGSVQAVIELGFFRKLRPAEVELMARVSEALGVAVRSARDRLRLEELLTETQHQAEELQAQQEELRVSNEELQEQGRILQDSRAQLEEQQAELEQTNLALAAQRDELANSQSVLSLKATELERANQYKSEFLANMSHELRTPLNSTLILSKLLADNRKGNLSAEEVKFAQTISSAGSDLLVLINDILDLAKIEAGQVDIQPETLALERIMEPLVMSFEPMAKHKGIRFVVTEEPGLPQRFETDAQRLSQILKNLLSNALKFTERGEVELRVSAPTEDRIAFTVRDTGIGIASEQHQVIFEAFRQADGSTHRKYGGTGLGLSISRDLARLLGGDISVHSEPGQGSVFTLVLPQKFNGSRPLRDAAPAAAPARVELSHAPLSQPALPAAAEFEDDREGLAAGARSILAIEDDPRFALILRDLAQEMGFKFVVTHTGGDGLAAAKLYRPKAILLDMNLPDHSGLAVLAQLKRDPQTRHIPVHVISVADYSQEARELGAVGYALKPVRRDQLVEGLQKLEAKFSQSLRRVLVVEDDARQLESIRQLLGNDEVAITGVSSAGQALAQLQETTFDCMVMDLNLPDLSGYELLETMAQREDLAFPPVIVYTGRSLARDEEEKLRRYSKSIIIKGVRSPERLLDEVTLFLHQVEATLPAESQRMLKVARDREATFEGRRILIVEDDVRNIFALTSVLEPKGVNLTVARNGLEALEALKKSLIDSSGTIDLVLMDIMMPEMDGITAMREIRKQPHWRKLPIIALTAKAMRDDQEKCLAAGASDYIAKPLEVEKLLSLMRVWMPK